MKSLRISFTLLRSLVMYLICVGVPLFIIKTLYPSFSQWGFFTLGVLGHIFVTYSYTLRPMRRVIEFLTSLVNQPKTENIRVHDVDFNEAFRQGEWKKLGELVRALERKLRRRTKAFLRETTELSAVMNSLDSPLVAVTTQMEVAFLNSAFAMLFELDEVWSKKEGMPQHINELVQDQRFNRVIQKALQTESFEKRMLPILIQDRPRIYSVSMTPLRRSDGSLYGVVAAFLDETLKAELDQKRMDFVANASHELRTPITAISTSVSLLQKVEDKNLREQILDSLDVNAKRLVSLTEELLNLSRLEGGAEELEWSHVSLKKITDEVVMGLSHPDKKHIEFQYQAELGWCDESKMKQVLTNLIRNALIYTHDQTKVEVIWRRIGEDLSLTIKDHGEGLSPEQRDRIFERFYRVDKSRSRRVGGSGLGLSIVKHIIHLHGGDIELKPFVKGQGAEFQCLIPQNGQSHVLL